MTHCYVNAIAGRPSLRPARRESLEILERITENKGGVLPFATTVLEVLLSGEAAITKSESDHPPPSSA
jgi:hypothetical protein